MAKDKNGNDWTVISSKKFLEHQINSLEEKVDLQFKLNDKALELFRTELTTRLEGMNEWRGQSKDLVSTMMPRSEQCIINDNVQRDLRDIRIMLGEGKGEKTGKKDMTATILAGIAILGFVINLVIQLMR